MSAVPYASFHDWSAIGGPPKMNVSCVARRRCPHRVRPAGSHRRDRPRNLGFQVCRCVFDSAETPFAEVRPHLPRRPTGVAVDVGVERDATADVTLPVEHLRDVTDVEIPRRRHYPRLRLRQLDIRFQRFTGTNHDRLHDPHLVRAEPDHIGADDESVSRRCRRPRSRREG